MTDGRLIVKLFLLMLIASSAAAAEVVLEKLPTEETGLGKAMEAWNQAELKRQDGKFKSHGWWPWGLRAFDFDNDGDLDLIASHHGIPGSMILRNELKETGKLRFVDCTKSLGVDHRELPGADDRPWIWDFDGDGYLDVAALSDESKKSFVWNRAGKKFETDSAGTSFHPVSHPIEVTDINGDGHPDLDSGSRGVHLYVTDSKTFEWIKKPRHGEPKNLPEELVEFQAKIKKTNKNNRFFRVKIMEHFVNGYDTIGHSPRKIDLNRDGIGDIIFAGQGGYGGTYLGRYVVRSRNGSLANKTTELGLPEDGCPIYFDDLTGDGHPDVLIAGKETGGFYENTGKGKFAEKENALTPFLRKRGPYLLRAFPADFDHDGLTDLLLSNPRLGRTTVYQNTGGGEFREVISTRGWDSNPNVICDINDDGLLDVVVGGPTKTDIAVFINRTKGHGHSARIHPGMGGPNLYAIDAIVSVYQAGDLERKNAKPIHVSKAHWDATPVHFGLGDRTEYDVRIDLPNGKRLERIRIEADQALVVTPDGKFIYRD